MEYKIRFLERRVPGRVASFAIPVKLHTQEGKISKKTKKGGKETKKKEEEADIHTLLTQRIKLSQNILIHKNSNLRIH